jgi:RNA polymerase sigma-70 factor (ECF subfamily)
MGHDDSKLFKKIIKGDLKAFESLFRKYYSYLCSVADRYCRDRDTAEEIVQDLFYRLWEKKQEISIDRSVKSYLIKAVYFNTINRMKQQRRDVELSNLHTEAMTGSSAEELVEMTDISELVEHTLNRLPARGQQIFRLSRLEGLTYREIAGKLGISVKTVEAYMGQALRLFRDSMKEYIR